MLALIMAGGKGRRLGLVNKPLLRVRSKPMIEHVLSKTLAVASHVVVALSKVTRGIEYLCRDLYNVDCVFTSGEEYVQDLSLLLASLRKPLLVMPADTPCISISLLRDFIARGMGVDHSVATFVVRKAFERQYLGISLFLRDGEDWVDIEYEWSPQLINVNTVEDLVEAERMCKNDS